MWKFLRKTLVSVILFGLFSIVLASLVLRSTWNGLVKEHTKLESKDIGLKRKDDTIDRIFTRAGLGTPAKDLKPGKIWPMQEKD